MANAQLMSLRALIKLLDYHKESEKRFVSIFITTKYC